MALVSEFEARLGAAFAELESRQPLMVARLQRWCEQNSGSHHVAGLNSMANILAEDFKELNLPIQRLAGDPIRWIDDQGDTQTQTPGELLIVHHNPTAKHRILMMIHYDTVYAPDAKATPVQLLEDGRLLGPGTADAKGGLLVMLEAARVLREHLLDTSIGWTMVVNPDEEIGSPASSRWMKENASRYNYGLLFEPTLPDGSLVSARKGSGNFSVIVRGKSAHAGRNPELGRNAVAHLCRILDKLDRLNEVIEGVSVNVARVSGGSALNQVPDLAIGRFNVRVVDDSAQVKTMTAIDELVKQFDRYDGFNVVLDGEFQSPPKMFSGAVLDLQRQVSKACDTIGRKIHWRSTGGACDGSKLAAAGLPNIDTLGPTGDCLHSADEWVDTHSLVPAAKTVVALIAEDARKQSA